MTTMLIKEVLKKAIYKQGYIGMDKMIIHEKLLSLFQLAHIFITQL